MRLVLAPRDRALASGAPHPEAAPTVAAAVGHVGVDLQVVPAPGEGRPVGERAEAAERGAHVRGFDEGVAGAGDGAADAGGVLQAGADFAHGGSVSFGGASAI
jgi:hypothetical protein